MVLLSMKTAMKLWWLGRKIERLLANQRKIMADFTALNAAVAANTTETAAVVTAFNGLKASAADQASVDAATAAIVANNAALTALVTPSS